MSIFWFGNRKPRPSRKSGLDGRQIVPGSFQQKEFLCLNKIICLQFVKIYATRQPIATEHSIMISRLLVLVHELNNLLAECVVDGERDT
jgi:hypothetical protein